MTGWARRMAPLGRPVTEKSTAVAAIALGQPVGERRRREGCREVLSIVIRSAARAR